MSRQRNAYSEEAVNLMMQLAMASETLMMIARGHTNNGRPLAAEESRQLARKALVALGRPWGAEAPDAPKELPL